MSTNIENTKLETSEKKTINQNDILHTLVTELHLLRKENIELKATNAELNKSLNQLTLLRKENVELKERNKDINKSVVEFKNKVLSFE